MSQKSQKVEFEVNGVRYVVFVDARRSNPNGQGQGENQPRHFDDGTVWASAESIKRGIRDTWIAELDGVPGCDVFVYPRRPIVEAIAAARPGRQRFDDAGEMAAAVRQKYIDARAFGVVLADGKAESGDDDDGGSKKKSKQLSIGLRGPVVVTDADSVEPTPIEEMDISRCCPHKDDNDKDHNQGKKWFVRYGRLRFCVYVEPHMARQSGFSKEDLGRLEDALKDVYKHRRTASRPDMRTVAVYRLTPREGMKPSSRAMDEITDRIQSKRVVPGDVPTEGCYSLPNAEEFCTEQVLVERID
jgi:CRISPR-associated protein Csd2